jgi:hypothetical protein
MALSIFTTSRRWACNPLKPSDAHSDMFCDHSYALYFLSAHWLWEHLSWCRSFSEYSQTRESCIDVQYAAAHVVVLVAIKSGSFEADAAVFQAWNCCYTQYRSLSLPDLANQVIFTRYLFSVVSSADDMVLRDNYLLHARQVEEQLSILYVTSFPKRIPKHSNK